MTVQQKMDAVYEKKLLKFEEKCFRLINQGQPYLAVILCHELYRFTYPFEPYANFTHDNPVLFMNHKIDQLLSLADQFSETVSPYAFKVMDTSIGKQILEKETSDLYSGLWKEFDRTTLTEESVQLLKNRLPESILNFSIKSARVLDMGCGSGRYTIALATLGAKEVVGVDFQAKSFAAAKEYCENNNIPVTFREANVLDLPFDDEYFDFVFCNGVVHHTSSINKGLLEIFRVLKTQKKAFLYIYGTGGIFWNTRIAMRKIFRRIPLEYTKNTLKMIGMPQNRFIFIDTWYVPVENHTKEKELLAMFDEIGFDYKKVVGQNPFDIDNAIECNRFSQAIEMWGEGEHRYILTKKRIVY